MKAAMERDPQTLTIKELSERYPEIEFPEYQREPTVWNREQKQRLIDSMLRQFDIAAIYLYVRPDGGLECIDGRQRLNAIMSFLGVNPTDDDDGFPIRIQNEVADVYAGPIAALEGKQFGALGQTEQEQFLAYPVVTIFLSGSLAPDEFNLQFLRLNLGTLINAGEKLHAMVGSMRDLLFESDRLGLHPFLSTIGVQTRRYAREQVAAQVALQVFTKADTGEFTRARHFDLQRFLKQYAELTVNDPRVEQISRTLDVLWERAAGVGPQLANRAICVSAITGAWDLELAADQGRADKFGEFLQTFLGRLRWQVANMKAFAPDERYGYLVEFQRNLTQAAVEKPAVTYRHRVLVSEFDAWCATGELTGDAKYREKVGEEPPVG